MNICSEIYKLFVENFINNLTKYHFMIVAVASLGSKLEDFVSPGLGFAKYIIVLNVENGEIKSWEVFDNVAPRGPFLTELVASKRIEAFISGRYGRGSYEVLRSLGVKTLVARGITVKEAALLAKRGELEEYEI